MCRGWAKVTSNGDWVAMAYGKYITWDGELPFFEKLQDNSTDFVQLHCMPAKYIGIVGHRESDPGHESRKYWNCNVVKFFDVTIHIRLDHPPQIVSSNQYVNAFSHLLSWLYPLKRSNLVLQ
jgi:hypothetical protein